MYSSTQLFDIKFNDSRRRLYFFLLHLFKSNLKAIFWGGVGMCVFDDWGDDTFTERNHIAYFLVHSRANSVYLSLSDLNILAISGTSGSSGFGSHRREQMDNNTLEIVSAGDHCDLRMSKQMLPFEFMFGW